MAHTPDPECKLDGSGNLVSLYKGGRQDEGLLSPAQVASCVRFKRMDIEINEDCLPIAVPLPHPETSGLKVNVVGGPTGAGKTSLINILAGGMETEPKHHSDTKCPTVYILKLEGGDEDVALLDTAGLCDTQATADGDTDMQELLINAVAATIQRFDMTVVSFLMCVDVGSRLPPNFYEVWPAMQIGLGGQRLDELCTFVVTKANGDSRVNKAKLGAMRKSEFWLQLEHSTLKWPVISAGREHLTAISGILKTTATGDGGVGADSVQSDMESLAKKRQIADKLQRRLEESGSTMERLSLAGAEWDFQISQMYNAIQECYEELASLGGCSGGRRQTIRRTIDDKKGELVQIQNRKKAGDLEGEDLRTSMLEWRADLDLKMQQIRDMEGIGAYWRSLATGVADAARLVAGGGRARGGVGGGREEPATECVC